MSQRLRPRRPIVGVSLGGGDGEGGNEVEGKEGEEEEEKGGGERRDIV